ncbi:MAG TPA: hypothetical protein VFF06_37420, partial [Polyangia bacterium]|nr:hypothetical protein [Polyangia bacterium]
SALNGALFDFNTDAFRKSFANGVQFTATATYHYRLKSKDGQIESTALFHFMVKPPPSGNIVVTPDPPTRAQQVTLHANVKNGSQYHWKVTGGACPAVVNKPAATVHVKEHDGQDWTFLPLCDFHVELHATDANGQSMDDSRDVSVQKRSDKWHLDFAADPAGPVAGTGRIAYDGLANMHNGMNRCAEQQDVAIADIECDWIHRKHGEGADYSEYFTIKTVSDDGPFNGYAYVDTQKLRTKRQFIVNADYLGGPLGDRNRKAGNGANFERVHQEIVAHEKMHSTLARKAVTASDPAQQVEAFVAESGDGFSDQVNDVIKTLDAQIGTAASEDQVGAALRDSGQWSDEALLCLPGADYLLDCGPLYALGTPLFTGYCKQATADQSVNKQHKPIACTK